MKVKDLEKVVPYVVSPWWRPPKTTISSNSKAAKDLHDVTRRISENTDILIYTDGSGINNKIGAAAVATQYSVKLESYLGTFSSHTVYTGELQGVNLALIFVITKKLERQEFNEVIVFTDNQAAILSCENSMNQSGQTILRIIAEKIDMLRSEGIEVRLQWVSAHEGIEGNELADQAAKHATGLRSVMNRKGRWEEKDTEVTAPLAGLPNVRSASKRIINSLAKDEWMQEWVSAKKGRSLYQVMKTSSSSMLKIHRNAEKWVSALLVQMRTQKIGLNKFLYDANVSEFDTPRCSCERDEQSVLHVLMNCPTYHKLRRRT